MLKYAKPIYWHVVKDKQLFFNKKKKEKKINEYIHLNYATKK